MAKNPKQKKQAAKEWFRTKLRSAFGQRKALMSNSSRYRSGTVIGKMYCFYYDPKHKDKLEVYDRFPLVFPIEMYNDGFLGLNLHYLSPGERQALLGRLMQFRTDTKMNARTKLQVSYDLLQGSKRLASLSRPCIKRYLSGHVRSRFVEITADEWDKVIDLDTADWVYNP